MLRTRCRFMVVLGIFAFAAVAAHAQTIFMPGTPEVDQLQALYQDVGRVFPVSSFPIAKSELDFWARDLASRIPLAAARVSEYKAAVLRLAPAVDRISASGAASLEYSYRSDSVNFEPGLGTALQGIDLQRLFLERPPLADIQFDFARDDGIELAVDMHVEREYWADPFRSSNLWEVLPQYGKPVALENQDIIRGTAWYDFHPLQVELGRDRVQMGPNTSSLLPSPDLPFLDVLRFRLPLGRLTGDLLVSTLENRPAPIDVSTDLPWNSTTILLAVHRYEYSFDTIRLGIAGRVLVARENNSFQLGDIFPVFSWHNADIIPNNMSLNADASWTPFPGLLLTGQFGVDDVNVSGVGVGDSGTPTIPAWIVAADYRLPLGSSLSADLSAEAGYTHYLWGNYAYSSTANNALARAIYRYHLDGGNVILPLTSPYGPGSTWVELSASFHGLAWLNASLTARYLSRMTDGSGIPVNLVTTPYEASSVIEAAPRIDTWSIGCKLSALPFGFLRLSLEPTLFMRESGAWVELNLGATLSGSGIAEVRQ